MLNGTGTNSVTLGDIDMRCKPKNLSVQSLIKMQKNGTLKVNPEYQRGSAWSRSQQKLFLDSILRGYPIPVIFLHEKKETVKDYITNQERTTITYEIIDGQQRITSLCKYVDGEYKLIDPGNEKDTKFPNFARKTETPWAGKTFEDLEETLRKKLLGIKISIIYIQQEQNSENEARDLFIRLQAGSALNDQEKRDAWPGNFTAFIFKIGGKHNLPGNPGHEFFPEIMKIRSTSSDRGKIRKIAAQMYLLCNSYSESKRFTSIKKESLDELYRINVDFSKGGDEAKKFVKCLDALQSIFRDEHSPKMLNHEVFHLALFVSSLLEDNYVEKKWMSGLKVAYDAFRRNCSNAKVITDDGERSKNEYWINYMYHTKTSADNPDTIARRHEFFSTKISKYMRERNFLISKDPKRAFTSVEREVIYFRDNKKCLVCDSDVVWREVEIHHVNPHSEGGETILENGALVHKNCHPKTQGSVEEFAVKFKEKNSHLKELKQMKYKTQKQRQIKLPNGTDARALYGGKEYFAQILHKGKWSLLDEDSNSYAEAKTPSGAAKIATGKNLNGWKFWEIKRPDDQNWIPLDSL